MSKRRHKSLLPETDQSYITPPTAVPPETTIGTMMSHYQLCPKCQGQGVVSRPPHIPADQLTWTDSVTAYTCDVCNGAKMLLVPSLADEKIETVFVTNG